MTNYSRFRRIGLQLLCFLPIARCMAPRVALPAIEMRDSLQGEARGIENPGLREPVRKYLETVPHFAQQVTIFPDLVQKDSLENEFIHLTEYLENFEKGEAYLNLRQRDRKSAEGILKQRNRLKAFHQLVLEQVQHKIIDAKPEAESSYSININKDTTPINKTARERLVAPLNQIIDSCMPQNNDYHRDHDAEAMVMILENAMIESLSKILLDIDSLKSKQPPEHHPTFLKLQNHVFQIVAYLYKHKMMADESFRKFCNTDRVVKIAAITMAHTFRLQYKLVQIGWSKIIPNYSNFSPYRIFLLGLEPYQKRYFSYLSLEQSLDNDFHAKMQMLRSPRTWIYFDSEFFGRLEKYNEAKLISRQALEIFKTGDQDYMRIKRDLGILARIFMMDEPSTPKEHAAQQFRSISFFILEFVQDNYGEEILQDIQTDQLIKNRMDFMLAYYQKSVELLNVIHYLKGGVDSDIQGHKCLTGIESGKKNIKNLHEEYLSISRYVDLIIQENQKFFTENKWKNWLISHNKFVTEIRDHIDMTNKKALVKIVV
ncbi:hypothetical protein Pst134EB_004374 [Puccinia striiformis f. sp. tritici]|nr:hypothetical protein Pst134EB_004374 [Puccinia striiformis f. sp. tritici]